MSRGGIECFVIAVGFGLQSEMDAVTCTELGPGDTIRLDNVTGGLLLHSVTVFYGAGFNNGNQFNLQWPDHWGDDFMGDMVIPTFVQYSRGNPPTQQPTTNQNYTVEGAYNQAQKAGTLTSRGYHYKYQLV